MAESDRREQALQVVIPMRDSASQQEKERRIAREPNRNFHSAFRQPPSSARFIPPFTPPRSLDLAFPPFPRNYKIENLRYAGPCANSTSTNSRHRFRIIPGTSVPTFRRPHHTRVKNFELRRSSGPTAAAFLAPRGEKKGIAARSIGREINAPSVEVFVDTGPADFRFPWHF